jgi:hypothetical protein
VCICERDRDRETERATETERRRRREKNFMYEPLLNTEESSEQDRHKYFLKELRFLHL